VGREDNKLPRTRPQQRGKLVRLFVAGQQAYCLQRGFATEHTVFGASLLREEALDQRRQQL